MPTRKQFGGRLLNAGVAGAGSLFARFATHPPRLPVYLRKDETFPAQDVEFPARDGLRLSGWFVPAKVAKGGVILCHGHPGTRMETLSRARWLHEAGFHVLLFDFRALGRSEGRVSGIGSLETQDLLGATDYMTQREETARLPLGVYGHSMGGAVAILTAAQDTRLEAVATHGAFATLESAIRQRAKLIAKGMAPIFEESVTRHGGRWLPIDPKELSPQAVVAQIAPRPILILHGVKDQVISVADAYALYEAARNPKELCILRQSRHIGICENEREEYRRTLCAFFTSALAKRNNA